MRSRIGPPLAVAVEGVWAGLFALLGRIDPHPVSHWTSPGGQRVLFVAPHPDDEIAGAAGTLVRHRRAGDRVTLLVVTDGRRSRALPLPPAEVARRRAQEARDAARLLDLELILLGLPEGEWVSECLEHQVREHLAEEPYDLFYVPSRLDYHPDHLRVARVLGEVIPAGARCRCYAVHVPLTARLTTLVTPLDAATTTTAVAARAAHASQVGSMERPWRIRRYTARRHRLSGLAEPFFELDGATYRALHRGDPDGWRPLRSLRPRPWGDPLAYLMGWRERRRVRALADSAR